MRLEAAICQLRSVMNDPEANVGKVLGCLDEGDLLVFPELFLTGYGAGYADLEPDVERCMGMIQDACRDADKAVAVGAPRYEGDRTYNSLAFVSPEGTVWYDKICLANFGVYAEREFTPGREVVLGEFRGIRFGMCVCYDVFFPEILRTCSVRGAGANICVAASAQPSKPFLDRVLPARALENVSYMLYANHVGPVNGLEMHGCSRGLDPFGEVAAPPGEGEYVTRMAIDTDRLAECREVRHNLDDFRRDVEWLRSQNDANNPKVLIR